MKKNDEIKIFFRIMPLGREYGVYAPLDTTGKILISIVLELEPSYRIAPNYGQSYTFKIISKRTGIAIADDKTLSEAGVEEEDILIISPNIIAGGPSSSGLLIYSLPKEMETELKSKVVIEISKLGFKEMLLAKLGFSKKDINQIEIGELMKVNILENAQEKRLIIKKLSTSKQLITGEKYSTKWFFDIVSFKSGTTSLLLKISLITKSNWFGTQIKEVFVFEQEVMIKPSLKNANSYSFNSYSYNQIEEITKWTEDNIQQVKTNIAQNEIGKAMTIFLNHFQKNRKIQNSVILLKAQYNESLNLFHLNIIETQKWLNIQTKISYALLKLADHIQTTNSSLLLQQLEKIKEIFEHK